MGGILCYEMEPGDKLDDIYAHMRDEIQEIDCNPRITWSREHVTRVDGDRVRVAALIKARW